ncbi:MAG: hypothetical protein ACQEQV_04700 [Fibrobacterota bacterium]
MKLARMTRISARALIGFNLIMAACAVFLLMRMTPAVDTILRNNGDSRTASREMLAAMSEAGAGHVTNNARDRFRSSLERAHKNITEEQETSVLTTIDSSWEDAFSGDTAAVLRTSRAISELDRINRTAMEKAEERARSLGTAGAWAVTVMALLIYLAGNLFLNSLRTNLLHPVEEIDRVIAAFHRGDVRRRCTTGAMPADMKHAAVRLNELLDRFATVETGDTAKETPREKNR